MCRGLTIGHLSRCDSLGIVVRKMVFRGAKALVSRCERWSFVAWNVKRAAINGQTES